MSLIIGYDTSLGGEFLTMNQIVDQLQTYKYIVTDSFASDLSANDYSSALIAKVFYKGNSESEAKAVWRRDDAIFPVLLFCVHGEFSSRYRSNIDLSDVNTPSGRTCVTIYPIELFEPDEKFGELLLTKQLKESKEDVWYVVRICDIDLAEHSFVGQVVLKSISKQEAVEVWEKSAEECGGDFYSKRYYIFNPALNGIASENNF